MPRPVTIKSVSLYAVPNAAWVEYIPQLGDVTTSRIKVEDGHALPPATPGLGIEWDWPAIEQRQVADLHIKEKA